MQFSKIALVLPLVLSSAIATPAPVREEQLPNQLSVTDNGVEEAGNVLAKRGFGCPIDYFCNNHVSQVTASPFTGCNADPGYLVQGPERWTNWRILQVSGVSATGAISRVVKLTFDRTGCALASSVKRGNGGLVGWSLKSGTMSVICGGEGVCADC